MTATPTPLRELAATEAIPLLGRARDLCNAVLARHDNNRALTIARNLVPAIDAHLAPRDEHDPDACLLCSSNEPCPDVKPGVSDLLDALSQVASALGCDNNLDDMLHAIAALAARDEAGAVAWAADDFYSNHPLPILHDDPAINMELLVQALTNRLDTARQALAAVAAMQVVQPALQQVKANAAWAMSETDPRRLLPRSVAYNATPPARGGAVALDLEGAEHGKTLGEMMARIFLPIDKVLTEQEGREIKALHAAQIALAAIATPPARELAALLERLASHPLVGSANYGDATGPAICTRAAALIRRLAAVAPAGMDAVFTADEVAEAMEVLRGRHGSTALLGEVLDDMERVLLAAATPPATAGKE